MNQETPKAPKLRFKEFNSNYKLLKLKDIGEVINGLTYSPKDIKKEPGILVLRSSNIKNDKLFFEDCVYVKENLKNIKITHKGDIVICVRNGSKNLIGKNALFLKYNIPTTHGAFMITFRTKVPEYFLQLFRTKRYKKQVSIDLGARINSINSSQFLNYKFLLPEEDEQITIGKFFQTIDNYIENLKSQKEELEKYKKGMMQKIFSQQIRFKDENGNNFPEWKDSKISEITDVLVGGTPSTSREEYWNGEINWISSGELNQKYINTSLKMITKKGLNSSSAKIMPKNTVLLAMTGATLGKISILNIEASGNQSVAGFIPNDNFEPHFLYFYLIYDKKQILSKAGGAAQAGINKKNIEELVIPLPSIKEQKKIADYIKNIDNLEEVINNSIIHLENWKKGLMQQMFI
jgi:type I restriction enzyme S subunit